MSLSPTTTSTTHLTSAPFQVISTPENLNPKQVAPPSQGSLAPIIMDSSVLSQGQASTLVSMPQSICFPSTGFSTGNVSPSITLPPASVSGGSSNQLKTLSMGSVFNLNNSILTPQLVHSLSMPQQPTLTVSLNQPSSQHNQQNIQRLPLGQSSSATIPLNQMIGSHIAPSGINFVNQTLFTVPNPSNGQAPFIPQHFGQIPIMLGGQPAMLSNNSSTIQSQSLATSSLSQSSSRLTTLCQTIAAPNISLCSVTNSSTILTGSDNTNSFPSKSHINKESPTAAIVSVSNEKQETFTISTMTNAESVVSSTTQSVAITPMLLVPNMVSVSTTSSISSTSNDNLSRHDTCTSHLSKNSDTKNIPDTDSCSQSTISIRFARMKFTPIEPNHSRSMDLKRKMLLDNDFDDDESNNEYEDDQESNLSAPTEQEARESPSSLSVTDGKIEQGEGQFGEDSKRSESPRDFRKCDAQGDLADGKP